MKNIFKSLFLISIVILSSSTSFAQTTQEERKGYTGNGEFILGVMEIGLNTTQGYRFNNKWSIGANTGVNISWCGPVMPLCAVGQFDINVKENLSVLINAKAGGVFALTNDDDLETRAGGNFAIGAGVRYKRMSYQLALNTAFLKHFNKDRNETLNGYSTFQLRIGYNFGAR